MSERRTLANQQNAQKSTGPRTPDGKAVSKLNALNHGLYSEVTLIDREDAADLVAFGRRLRADLAPVGELELMLADKIVSTAWRLRRLVGVEADLYGDEDTSFGVFTGYSGDRMLRLGRYEAGLERAMYRALHELQRLQAARNGATVAPPDVVDVTSISDSDEPGAMGSFRQSNEFDGDYCEVEESPEPRA